MVIVAASILFLAKAWEIRSFQKGNNRISYSYQKSSATTKGSNKNEASPLLCIHPIGVGMASWYWNKLMAESLNERDIYAINLPGCGFTVTTDAETTSNDLWDPSAMSLKDIPTKWLDACQLLLDEVILSSDTSTKSPLQRIIRPQLQKCCHVLVQGGLAPVGVKLAANNPERIRSLILASPPKWDDMTTIIPQKEIQFNFDFLASAVFGKLAFALLESRLAIDIFSNAFLFKDKCDQEWLDETVTFAVPEARLAVQAFNAGILGQESYDAQLCTMKQPVCILQGSADTESRKEGRTPYTDNMPNAVLQTLDGKSLLPWEYPKETWNAITQFIRKLDT